MDTIVEMPSGDVRLKYDDGKILSVPKNLRCEVKVELARDERGVILHLFEADARSRTYNQIASDLGITEATVKNWVFCIRQGREMSEAKYQVLKKAYNLDEVLK